MKIILFCLCVVCSVVPLLAGSDVNGWSCDEIMRGLRSHSKSDTYPELKARQKWMSDLWVRQTMLTNEAERAQLANELVQILNSKEFNHEDKCAAAYLIGLFRITKGIQSLIDNFLLGSKAALEPDLMPIEGGSPAQKALMRIGEPAISEVMELIKSTTNSYALHDGAKVVLFIKGQEDGAKVLKQAIADQADSKKKENLKAALASEYFTDPKYRLSGPEEKVKAMLARESQNAGVTNKTIEK